MAYPQKTLGIFSLLFAVFLLNGCTQFIEGEQQAWPGVSAGSTSLAPAFTAPVGGGQFGQRTPPDVLQNTYGYRGEDLSATAPSQTDNGLYSYDSSRDTGLSSAVNNANDGSGTGAGYSNQSNNGYDTANNANTSANASQDDEDYNPEDPVEDWLASEGSSIRSLLTEWGDKAGWRVVWSTDREYILEAGAMFRGRFMDVSSALIRSFARTRPAPWGTFYKGNRVLLVTTQEDENAD